MVKKLLACQSYVTSSINIVIDGNSSGSMKMAQKLDFKYESGTKTTLGIKVGNFTILECSQVRIIFTFMLF